MTIRFSSTSRDAGLNANLNLMDAGPGAGTIKIYSGAQPATADTAETGTLLATFTCADPAWAPASGGVKALDADPDLSTVGLAAGTAGWARCEDSTGVNVMDGSVGATGSGADFILSNTSIAVDQAVNLTQGTITDPA